jgi:hypothetical protein
MEVALTGVTFAVPMEVLPSLNVTVPVGPWVLLLWEPIVTDKVTCWFAGTGLGLALSEADVVAGVTVTETVVGALGGL